MWYHFLLPFVFSGIFIVHFNEHPLQFGLFLIGVWLGFAFILLDRFLHALYVEPDLEFSKKVQSALKHKQYKNLLTLMSKESLVEQTHLISRSTIFIISYMAISIYVITSTTNALGKGLVLGIGLHYCLDLLIYKDNVNEFVDQFLWQVKRKFNQAELKWLVGGFVFYFVMLTLLALR